MGSSVRKPVLLRLLAYTQSIYYLLTGIWPMVHMSSFLAVTGPKTDLWLVQTVGLVITAIGLGLFQAIYTGTLTRSHATMATFAAFSLAGIGFYYVYIGRISWIYLLDAVPEVAFGIMWVVFYGRLNRS